MQKTHLTGWIEVNMRSQSYDAHWLYLALVTALFICLSGRLDVYRRIKWMEDYREDTNDISETKKGQKLKNAKSNELSSSGSSTAAQSPK